jgi:hypothetical protein
MHNKIPKGANSHSSMAVAAAAPQMFARALGRIIGFPLRESTAFFRVLPKKIRQSHREPKGIWGYDNQIIESLHSTDSKTTT